MLRLFNKDHVEVAYFVLGISGLQATLELPSDWHEHRRAWICIGLGLMCFGFSFAWTGKVVPDEGQCSGPTYGFQFFSDLLWIKYGKATGRPATTKSKAFHMPWAWEHQEREELSGIEVHPFRYTLESGEVQERQATIQAIQRTWTRWWPPFKRIDRSIVIDFDKEVGEKTGSWKGGVMGCSYRLAPGESPIMALLHMEQHKKL